MAWTTPRTWVTSEIPTAAIFNAHVRDNMIYLEANPVRGCLIEISSSQSINSSSETAVSWSLDNFDSDALHDTGSNPERVTIPSGLGGKWHFTSTVAFAANATGYRYAKLRKNGSTLIDYDVVNAASTGAVGMGSLQLDTVDEASASDYYEVLVWQNSGSPLNATGGLTQLAAIYRGA